MLIISLINGHIRWNVTNTKVALQKKRMQACRVETFLETLHDGCRSLSALHQVKWNEGD